MKNISLREACQLLNKHKAVIIADHLIRLDEIEFENNPEKEFLYLEWNDGGFDFNVSFLVKDNRNVEFDGKTLYLISSYGDVEELTLSHL